MTVSITINGKTVAAKEGECILEAAVRRGFDIPHLCWHQHLTPYASCRLCLVEVETGSGRRISTSCNYPVAEGMKIRLDTQEVLEQRRSVFEALLAQAPGSEKLRDYAARYGVTRTPLRLQEGKCILCGLCVRMCDEIVGASAITFACRGKDRAVKTPFDEISSSCIACGACAEVCPTEAIVMEAVAVRMLRERRGEARWCRYHLMGISPGTLCPMNYDCARCEIDQGFRSWYGGHPLIVSAVRRQGKKG